MQTIRYTVDGTVPTTSDLLYEKPIQLTGPTILRAKAFKTGLYEEHHDTGNISGGWIVIESHL